MEEQTWIWVPEVGEGAQPWTGRIWTEGEKARRWRFEVLRQSGVSGLYGRGKFEDGSCIPVLLDYQRPGTLVRPLALVIDPGKVGLLHPYLRTRIEGSFQALLAGKALEDEDEPVFTGIGFESQTFSAWYGGRQFTEQMDGEYRTQAIQLRAADGETVAIEGIGELEAKRHAVFESDHSSGRVRTRTILRVTTSGQRTLREVIELCVGLELLFGFLVGFRPEPPTFHPWWPPRSDLAADDPRNQVRDAELAIGDVEFRSGRAPHPHERMHMNGRDEAGLSKVVGAFAQDRSRFLSRIHAVQVGRWFGRTINEKFAMVMPVFEHLVQGRYLNGEERSYVEARERFFAHVDVAADPEIPEFARKHLKEVGSKAAPLKELVRRALEDLVSHGFRFDPAMAEAIARRRAKMFHSVADLDETDARGLHLETRIITAALMLLTLRDLGVDIAPLSGQHHAMADFGDFLHPPAIRIDAVTGIEGDRLEIPD